MLVKPDPRSPITEAERKAYYDLTQRAMKPVAVVTEAADRLRDARDKEDLVNKQLGERDDEKAKSAKKLGKETQDKIKKLLNALLPDPDVQGIVRSPKVITGILGNALGYLQAAEGMPTSTEQNALKNMEAAVKAALPPINDFFEKDWTAYQKAVAEADPKLFETYSPLKMD